MEFLCGPLNEPQQDLFRHLLDRVPFTGVEPALAADLRPLLEQVLIQEGGHADLVLISASHPDPRTFENWRELPLTRALLRHRVPFRVRLHDSGGGREKQDEYHPHPLGADRHLDISEALEGRRRRDAAPAAS